MTQYDTRWLVYFISQLNDQRTPCLEAAYNVLIYK